MRAAALSITSRSAVRMLRALLLGTSLAAVAALAPVQAAEIEPLRVGNWEGGAYTDDETGRFSHCTVGARYRSGISMFFTVTKDYNWAMAFQSPEWRLNNGQQYPLRYQIDRGRIYNASGRAFSGNALTVPLPDSVPLFNEFRAGRLLFVEGDGQSLQFQLTTTSRMLQVLLDCARRNQDRGARPNVSGNPFGGGSGGGAGAGGGGGGGGGGRAEGGSGSAGPFFGNNTPPRSGGGGGGGTGEAGASSGGAGRGNDGGDRFEPPRAPGIEARRPSTDETPVARRDPPPADPPPAGGGGSTRLGGGGGGNPPQVATLPPAGGGTPPADRRDEARTTAAAVITRAGVGSFRFVVGDEIPASVRDHDAVWTTDAMLGTMRIVGPERNMTVDDIRAQLIAGDVTRCRGRFASGVNPGEASDPRSSSLFTACDGDSGWSAFYIVSPRREGGSYVITLAGRPESDAAIRAASTAFRNAAGTAIPR